MLVKQHFHMGIDAQDKEEQGIDAGEEDIAEKSSTWW